MGSVIPGDSNAAERRGLIERNTTYGPAALRSWQFMRLGCIAGMELPGFVSR
jgi:hypothetical protein